MTKQNKILLTTLIIINTVIIALLIIYPHYRSEADENRLIGFCFLKNFFKVYCATCGGTRAFGDILSFDIVSALKHNAVVVFVFGYIIFSDIYAVIAVKNKKERIIPFRPIHLGYFVIMVLLFTIIRNILVYSFGFDPIGDLLK